MQCFPPEIRQNSSLKTWQNSHLCVYLHFNNSPLSKIKSTMRYIGSKALMLDNILYVINQHTKNVKTVGDIFAGSGAVSRMLMKNDFTVFSNDFLYLSYILNKGMLETDTPLSDKLRSAIDHLNNLTPENSPWFDIDTAFIYQNYSPHDKCERMYFQCNNAIKIDLIRQEIERQKPYLTNSEYYYLLSLLLNAVPYISNITGTYGAYLKYWDKRTFNPLTLKEIETPLTNGNQCRCFNMNAEDFANQTEFDLAYLDPPYNGRQYLPNYHILETIALYDKPLIKGKTGIRIDHDKMSDFCKKTKAETAFRRLLNSLKCRYILLSYNNEGLLNTETMTKIIKEQGKANSFQLYEYDYRRYKNKIPNNTAGLKEQLYFIEKQ